jgi:hypothetical protein
MSLVNRPNEFFASLLAITGSMVHPLAGLPDHLRVVNEEGKPINSLRRQFQKGKASKKKRGK